MKSWGTKNFAGVVGSTRERKEEIVKNVRVKHACETIGQIVSISFSGEVQIDTTTTVEDPESRNFVSDATLKLHQTCLLSPAASY